LRPASGCRLLPLGHGPSIRDAFGYVQPEFRGPFAQSVQGTTFKSRELPADTCRQKTKPPACRSTARVAVTPVAPMAPHAPSCAICTTHRQNRRAPRSFFNAKVAKDSKEGFGLSPSRSSRPSRSNSWVAAPPRCVLRASFNESTTGNLWNGSAAGRGAEIAECAEREITTATRDQLFRSFSAISALSAVKKQRAAKMAVSNQISSSSLGRTR
jgi:hypothetical protein